jgi:hypothetical protein
MSVAYGESIGNRKRFLMKEHMMWVRWCLMLGGLPLMAAALTVRPAILGSVTGSFPAYRRRKER